MSSHSKACDDVRSRLTAYLDGDLDADRGTVVRGHLRGCAACREIASDEAALRDGLRVLPTVDPPASMWAGVQARLAAADVAESERPTWRRTISRWGRWARAAALPRFATGGLVVAAAVTVLWWRMPGTSEDTAPRVVEHPSQEPGQETDVSPNTNANPRAIVPSSDDVTADLAAEPARTTTTYADAAEDLLALAGEVRTLWTEEQNATFDGKLIALRETIARAAAGRPQQRAWRALIRYLQGAIVRDDIALASGGVR